MEERSSKSTGVRSLNGLPENLLLRPLLLAHLARHPNKHSLRKWRSLWSSVPSLNFDYPVFLPPEESSQTCLFFSNFVDRPLLSRPHNPILKFHLQFDYFDDYYHGHVDTWLRYAIELDFYFFVHRTVRTYHLDSPNLIFYDFAFSALRNGCVRVLKLWYCDLALPANMSTLGLLSLRLLSLDQIFVTDEMVSDLIEGCPNIEDLVCSSVVA